jgi:hypothetical protein
MQAVESGLRLDYSHARYGSGSLLLDARRGDAEAHRDGQGDVAVAGVGAEAGVGIRQHSRADGGLGPLAAALGDAAVQPAVDVQ